MLRLYPKIFVMSSGIMKLKIHKLISRDLKIKFLQKKSPRGVRNSADDRLVNVHTHVELERVSR